MGQMSEQADFTMGVDRTSMSCSETRPAVDGAGSGEFAMVDVISERDRRVNIWHSNQDLENVDTTAPS
jgi:hypothetical protein